MQAKKWRFVANNFFLGKIRFKKMASLLYQGKNDESEFDIGLQFFGWSWKIYIMSHCAFPHVRCNCFSPSFHAQIHSLNFLFFFEFPGKKSHPGNSASYFGTNKRQRIKLAFFPRKEKICTYFHPTALISRGT